MGNDLPTMRKFCDSALVTVSLYMWGDKSVTKSNFRDGVWVSKIILGD